jgi:3-methyladenine DNA glycosylase AlkD
VSALLRRLQRELAKEGDPARAAAMQAYMKSSMPFHGVPSPVTRKICKKVFAEHAIDDAKTWQKDVLAIFRGAKHREEWYAAVHLCSDRRARPFQTMDALPMYDELITGAAWWDIVDVLASHQLGAILRNEPAKMKKKMLAWSRDANMWRARSSILCQLGFKKDIDLDLLYACIEPSLASKEFFLRKAIGWALRQHAWTDPAEVKRYVARNRARMSGLSIREALKNIEK